MPENHVEKASHVEIHERKFTLSQILEKLGQYTIMVQGVSDALSNRGEDYLETFEKYALAERILDSLIKTPALFEGLDETVRGKYAHHDLFQDFYNKVVSRCTLMHDSLVEFHASTVEYNWSAKDDEDVLKVENALAKLEEDIEFFERMVQIWPYYELIMEALVVRSYNIESGYADEYFVPEKIENTNVQKDVNISQFYEIVRNFFRAYPKRVYMDDISLWFDQSLQDAKIHISQGVLFNLIRNIIGNVISPEKQSKICAHKLLIGFSLFIGAGGEPYVHITISDDGRGMSSQTLTEIFKEGVSGTESTGLGLAHTDDFIKSMHGNVFVESREVEKPFTPNNPFRFQDIKELNVSEFVEAKGEMHTIFTLQFPLVQE
jgi:hypothetical protein